MDNFVAIGKLLKRYSSLLSVGQPDAAEAYLGDASDIINNLSDTETNEAHAFLSGFFAALAMFGEEFVAMFNALQQGTADPATKRSAITVAIQALR